MFEVVFLNFKENDFLLGYAWFLEKLKENAKERKLGEKKKKENKK